jgi:hypothetical protein
MITSLGTTLAWNPDVGDYSFVIFAAFCSSLPRRQSDQEICTEDLKGHKGTTLALLFSSLGICLWQDQNRLNSALIGSSELDSGHRAVPLFGGLSAQNRGVTIHIAR